MIQTAVSMEIGSGPDPDTSLGAPFLRRREAAQPPRCANSGKNFVSGHRVSGDARECLIPIKHTHRLINVPHESVISRILRPVEGITINALFKLPGRTPPPLSPHELTIRPCSPVRFEPDSQGLTIRWTGS